MEIDKKDFDILAKYYDQMFRIVANQACSCLTLEMRDEVYDVLQKYGKLSGCSNCNSNVVRMMIEACSLYKQNVDRFTKKNKKIKND